MSTLPSNLLQNVATFNKAGLGALENTYAMISVANKKFEDFEKIEANLGTTVNMRVRYHFTTAKGITTTMQGVNQNLHPLVVDDAYTTGIAIPDLQRVFNLKTEEYMAEIGEDIALNHGAKIETAISAHVHSLAPVANFVNNLPVPTGAYHYESGPYRFYGDGSTAINSVKQLDKAVRAYKNMGAVGKIKIILPDTAISDIVDSALSQFVMKRNEDAAASWDVGRLVATGVDVMTSNLLPIHTSGTIGNTASTGNQITISALVTDSNGNITGFTGTTSVTADSQALMPADVMQFVDSVAGHSNVRFATHVGDAISSQPVQVRNITQAASSGGNITFSIFPALTTNPANVRNNVKLVSSAIEVGMKLAVMPSHRCGLIIDDGALYLAMPKLPDTEPYSSTVATDKSSGASMRLWYGYIPSEGAKGIFYNNLLGATIEPNYCSRILFPLSV